MCLLKRTPGTSQGSSLGPLPFNIFNFQIYNTTLNIFVGLVLFNVFIQRAVKFELTAQAYILNNSRRLRNDEAPPFLKRLTHESLFSSTITLHQFNSTITGSHLYTCFSLLTVGESESSSIEWSTFSGSFPNGAVSIIKNKEQSPEKTSPHIPLKVESEWKREREITIIKSSWPDLLASLWAFKRGKTKIQVGP